MTRVMISRDAGAWLEHLGSAHVYPQVEEVARARRWFRRFAGKYLDPDAQATCTLMLSELVTNAVLHGQGEGAELVRAEWWRIGHTLRVAVHSAGERWDKVRPGNPGTGEEHGRGLLLVRTLADSWHAGPSPYGGAQVWFDMRNALGAPAPGGGQVLGSAHRADG